MCRCCSAGTVAAILLMLVAGASHAQPFSVGGIRTLSIEPTAVQLRGGDAAVQLLITASLTDGRLQDVTCDVVYQVTDEKVARVGKTGRVLPLANGETTITARIGSFAVSVPLSVSSIGTELPINFANQVVPIFTKLGCNGGGCHGKQTGQNGFRLSLLGFDPELDYTSLIKESRGRRTFPAAPEQSLLLRKASGAMAHGGGKRIDPDSDEYKLVRRWIASGTPYGLPGDPIVDRITVHPAERTLSRHNHQQIAVIAHYSDGRTEDVTRRAQYDCNDPEIATVEPSGLVRTLGFSGQAAIMARFSGKVAAFRAIVPLGIPVPEFDFKPATIVDHFTSAQWRVLGLAPAELSSDEQFLRRVSLDVTGTLPSAEKVRSFVADTDGLKRSKLIDQLLESPEYSYYFANKWSDLLRVRRRREEGRAAGTFAFHEWIRESIAADKRYDEFVRELLTATGEETRTPQVVWYKELQTPDQFVDDVSQVFLGQRVACAQCHHHPYERWSQDDYWSLAAFFGRIGRKPIPTPGVANQQRPPQLIYNRAAGAVTNKRTGRPAPIRALDGDVLDLGPGDDARAKLVDWMVDPKNPFFARAIANRYWAHFFSRGIVDPLDDMRVTNPPTNPELLDVLAADFVKNKYSLKSLIRTICNSRTYQLAAAPNEWNKNDKQNFARYYPKRMSAETLVDAVSQVTGSPTVFANLPKDRNAPQRAMMLPDEAFPSYFLDVFGRPQRISACECERISEPNLAQVIHLLNSEEVQAKLGRAGGRADLLARDSRPDAEKFEELVLIALGRKPTDEQTKAALAHLEKRAAKKKLAYEDLIWTIVNTKEFLFIQ